jgi:peptide/nickel transport system ATP-binding protein
VTATAPLLGVRGLTVSYHTDRGPLTALADVSFAVPEGQAVGLVGESGSGKSTAALTILGLLGAEATVRAGAVEFVGRDLLRLSPAEWRALRGDRIGLVFQDPFSALNPSLRVGLQIAEPLIHHRGLGRAEALRAARELLARVGIPRPDAVARAYPHQLSGGMQQRALVATALACNPALLVLDEPTTALDVTIEAQILDLLEALRAAERRSLLFISHNLGVVYRLCETVCILYAGRVVEEGPTREVFRGPLHPYTKGLLASLPRGRSRRLTPIPGAFPDLRRPPSGCVFHPRCPYAEPRCAEEPQALRPAGPGRAVRCWKADQLVDVAWPEPRGPEPTLPAAGRPAPLVEARELRKEYRLGGFWAGLRLGGRPGSPWPVRVDIPRVRAVDGVSLSVAPGEVLGLVGESGCGKSTLGRCLLRLVEPTSGRVLLDGQEITRLSPSALRPTRRLAQIVFQNPDSSLNPRKTVGEIVGRPLAVFGLADARTRPARVTQLLDMVRLPPDYARRYPHQLSGGEKQRVGIARALAPEPRFLVCDEPVSALDVSVQASILNLLADLRDQLGLAYLFISHDLSAVAHLATRVAVMYQGTFCEVGTVDEVLRPPYHPYTQALLSAIPLPEPDSIARPRIRLRGDPTALTAAAQGCRFHARCPKKIGRICEDVTPPIVEPSPGHRIACHIPLDELKGMEPTAPVGWR